MVALHNYLAGNMNAEAKQIACNEDLWQCVYHFGANERFIPMVASMPDFAERPVEEAASHPVGAFRKLLEEGYLEEDRREIEDFKRKLLFNLGEARAPVCTCEAASVLVCTCEAVPVLVCTCEAAPVLVCTCEAMSVLVCTREVASVLVVKQRPRPAPVKQRLCPL